MKAHSFIFILSSSCMFGIFSAGALMTEAACAQPIWVNDSVIRSPEKLKLNLLRQAPPNFMILKLMERGQIEEACAMIADNKEQFERSRNQFYVRTLYLNAIRLHSQKVIDTLLALHLKPENREDRQSLLEYALWKREKEMAEHLKEGGFETTVYAEVAMGNLSKLQEVLKEKNAVKMRDTNGRTLLHWAALDGQVYLIKPLLAAGASVDDCPKGSAAKKHKRKKAAKEEDKPENKEESESAPFYLSPLAVAIANSCQDACKLLIENGAKPNGRPGDETLPLALAARMHNRLVIDRLLAAGADLNGRDSYGRTALHYAAMANDAVITEYLLKLGADKKIVDKQGKRASDLTESQPVLKLLKGE
ncbi:MAG: ankyrin repeat domain-containing protein [Candidatus Melainabacteria bacterium]|nr:ankyrin repeat domain-containing protein [Candidatus Melainabacteria bacterium]